MRHNYDRQFNGMGLPAFVAVYAVLNFCFITIIVVFLFSTPVDSIF